MNLSTCLRDSLQVGDASIWRVLQADTLEATPSVRKAYPCLTGRADTLNEHTRQVPSR